jgi:hypothetical protein
VPLRQTAQKVPSARQVEEKAVPAMHHPGKRSFEMFKQRLANLLLLTLLITFPNVGYSQNPFQGFSKWYGKVKSQFLLDSERNHAYPQPFLKQDQIAYRGVFAPMLAKGSAVTRILDAVHFDEKSHHLNGVGIAKLRNILSQQKNLDILVASSMNPEVDKAREGKIRELLSQYSFPGTRPRVAGVFYQAHHGTGSEHAIRRETFLSNQPAPNLNTVSGEIAGSAE